MRPDSETALAEIVAAARGPLSIRGGNTRGMAGEGEALETGGLNGVALYEPGALTLVAGAGTPLGEIETMLAAEGQRLAFEPMDHRGLLGTNGLPTIGGVAAANVSGPRRIQAGAARDFLLGVRFVDGHGRIVQNGGRVMKNVTGYDLVKLMAGACGQLGILTEVSLKVLPAPETEATLVLEGLDGPAAVAAMARALGSPFEVSGAAHLAGAGETALRLEGFESSVAYRMGRLADLFSATPTRRVEAAASARLWEGVRDVAAFHGQPGDVWRIAARPGDAPAILSAVAPDDHLLDWGGGLIWVRVAASTDLRQRLGGQAARASLVRADAATRARLGTAPRETDAVAALTRGLRLQFDPKGLFSTEAVPA